MATANSTGRARPACEVTGLHVLRPPQDSDRALRRVEDLLVEKSALAWKLHNVLAFMVEAVPYDEPDGLPLHCTLADLRCDMEQLATSLQVLVHHARHAPDTGDE